MPELFRLQNNSGIQNTKNTKQKLILLVCNAYNCNKKNTYRKRIIPIARMRTGTQLEHTKSLHGTKMPSSVFLSIGAYIPFPPLRLLPVNWVKLILTNNGSVIILMPNGISTRST